MQLVNAQKLIEMGHEAFKAGDLDKAERLYNEVFNKSFHSPEMCYMLGTLYMQKGFHALGAQLLSYCCEKKPDIVEAWNNLGICLTREFHIEEAQKCYDRAEKLRPDVADIPANRASPYINNGTPMIALEHAERALKIDPDHSMGQWHKALALLEMGRFKEGWPLHESRLIQGTTHGITIREYGKPKWDGKKVRRLVVHGEQGLGDEIMFASALPFIRDKAEKIVVECSPRLEDLFRRSFPDFDIVGTNKHRGEDLPYAIDAWTALGSLPFHLKWNRPKDFNREPYILPDPEKVAALRYGSVRPRVGVAWQGGMGRTRVDLRSLRLEMLRGVIERHDDVDWVSLQYTQNAEEEIKRSGLPIEYRPEAQAENMDDAAALVASCDIIFTVCQTAVHLAGSMGIKTHCLTPSRPSWRYGIKGGMTWYSCVDLHRQKGDDWGGALEQAEKALDADLRRISRTE